MQGDAIERARKLVGIDLPVLLVKALLEQQASNMNATVLNGDLPVLKSLRRWQHLHNGSGDVLPRAA
ncbi:hypothetical protein V8Z78_20335 [Comamonas sp. wu1-DMT]